MSKKKLFGWFLPVMCSLLFACDLKDNEVLPSENFVRIYETDDFQKSYIPVDIRQTEDGGYLALAGVSVSDSNFPAAYLLKVDKEGMVEWEHLSESFVNPVSELMPEDPDQFTFVAMDKNQLGTHIVKVSGKAEGGESPASLAWFGAYSYPLAAAAVQGGFSILHWNRDNKSSIQLSRLNNISPLWSRSYDIYEDVESQIMEHLTRQRQPLIPFQVGSATNGSLYFNGYNNFTLALTFVNGQNGQQTGVVNGARYASGISQVLALKDGEFAMASFKADGGNVYTPAVRLETNQVLTAKDLAGNELPELTSYAGVKIRQIEINSENYTLFASTTKNGQITLFAYDKEGNLQGTKYLGAGNRFEAGSLQSTDDGGLVILGKVYVAGRFPRLCLFKMGSMELSELVGNE